MSERITLEVIALSAEDAVAAEAGGADRLEVIADYAVGGITPDPRTLEAIRRAVSLPLYVIVRPRGGGFVYTEAEVAEMVEGARIARELGANGIVTGALTPDGQVDLEVTRRVLAAAGLPATFHRALDAAAQTEAAYQQVASLPGVERVLTSGGAPSVAQGAETLRRLVALSAAPGAPVVMAGAGITLENVADIIGRTGVRAVHVGMAARENTEAPVSAQRVEQLRRIIDRR